MADYQISYASTVTDGYLSAINTNGKKYIIKDTAARENTVSNALEISALWAVVQGGVHYRGTTTTALKDGDPTNPITIGGKSYTAAAGDIVLVSDSVTKEGNIEFVFDGTNWQRLGSMEGLGEWAWWNGGKVTITPKGSVGISSTTIGDVDFSNASFAGTAKAPTGKVTVDEQELTASFTGTPATLCTTFTGTPATLTVTLTADQLCALNVTPTFTGKSSTITANFEGTQREAQDLALSASNSLNVTPTFTGTEKTYTVDLTAGQVTPTGVFDGTEGDLTVKGTPAGTISCAPVTVEASFSGTEFTPTAKFTGTAVTPEGTISRPTVTVTQTSAVAGTANYDAPTETLTISFNNVLTAATAALDADPVFTGTQFTPAGSISCAAITPAGNVTCTEFTPAAKFTGTELTSTGKFTPAGDITINAFTPSISGSVKLTPEGTISQITYTPAGKVVLPAYTPAGSVTGTVTPLGDISTITYKPAGSTTVSYTPAGTIGNISYTPAGSVSVSDFEAQTITLDMDDYTPEGTVTGKVVIPAHAHEANFVGTTEDYAVVKVS